MTYQLSRKNIIGTIKNRRIIRQSIDSKIRIDPSLYLCPDVVLNNIKNEYWSGKQVAIEYNFNFNFSTRKGIRNEGYTKCKHIYCTERNNLLLRIPNIWLLYTQISARFNFIHASKGKSNENDLRQTNAITFIREKEDTYNSNYLV